MRFEPHRRAHTRRQDAQTDVLARSPASPDGGHLDTGHPKLGDGVQVGLCDLQSKREAQNEVCAVQASGDGDKLSGRVPMKASLQMSVSELVLVPQDLEIK